MSIQEKIREEKGGEWVEKTCGSNDPSTPSRVAGLVYYHYLDSEDGQRRWYFVDSDGEEKVDEIFDSIHSEYVLDREWMTEDEWQTISQELYNMVYEGVF